jgi:hypothetical protein
MSAARRRDMRPFRVSVHDFPDLVLHADELALKKHPMDETSKTGGEKGSGSASTALPGRKLVTSKSPRMLKPFEIELLQQDLKAALARLRAARSR